MESLRSAAVQLTPRSDGCELRLQQPSPYSQRLRLASQLRDTPVLVSFSTVHRPPFLVHLVPRLCSCTRRSASARAFCSPLPPRARPHPAPVAAHRQHSRSRLLRVTAYTAFSRQRCNWPPTPAVVHLCLAAPRAGGSMHARRPRPNLGQSAARPPPPTQVFPHSSIRLPVLSASRPCRVRPQ
jgi:hypothetical protein